METGIFIRYGSKSIDIGDNKKIGLPSLLMWINGLGIEGMIRVIITLLGRRVEYDNYLHNKNLNQYG